MKRTSTPALNERALDKELARIDVQMKETIQKLSQEVESGDSPTDDAKVEGKVDRVLNTLTHEMMQLAGKYHRQKDIARIKQFLDEQKAAIQAALTTDDEEDKRKSLATHITELHKIMADERRRLRRISRKELLKFLITLAIALLSLAVSVYALSRQ